MGEDERGAPPGRATAKQVAAVVAGNALDFYDFLTYAFFAVQIGHTFFPSSDHGASLLASLATFGAGFLTRPLGALVIGRYADRAGRKPAMLLSFSLMGLGIVGLALTPGYRSIGLAAPVIAIGFRLIQGFALGGEVGPSTAFLMEAAPRHRRGLYVSLQFMGQDAAVLCAGLVGFVLSSRMDARALDDYGWRIAFLIGAAIVPFALVLRRHLEETLQTGGTEDAAPDRAAGSEAAGIGRLAGLGLVLVAVSLTIIYLLDYLTTYATEVLHLSEQTAFAATIVLGFTCVCFDPVGGWLSDRFGRRPVTIGAWGLFALLVVPCFRVINHQPSLAVLFGVIAVLAILSVLAAASALVAVTEALPKTRRAGSLSLIYAVGVSVFGGSAQFNVAKLTAVTGNVLAPAWYMAAACLIGVAAMLAMRETAPARTANLG